MDWDGVVVVKRASPFLIRLEFFPLIYSSLWNSKWTQTLGWANHGPLPTGTASGMGTNQEPSPGCFCRSWRNPYHFSLVRSNCDLEAASSHVPTQIGKREGIKFHGKPSELQKPDCVWVTSPSWAHSSMRSASPLLWFGYQSQSFTFHLLS